MRTVGDGDGLGSSALAGLGSSPSGTFPDMSSLLASSSPSISSFDINTLSSSRIVTGPTTTFFSSVGLEAGELGLFGLKIGGMCRIVYWDLKGARLGPSLGVGLGVARSASNKLSGAGVGASISIEDTDVLS